MELLDKYKESLKAIHEYFNFEEDWCVYPIDDRREMYWFTVESSIIQFKKLEDYTNLSDEIYTDTIWRYSGYPQILKGPNYSMILINTQTDGNVFWAIYCNDKEVPFNPYFLL